MAYGEEKQILIMRSGPQVPVTGIAVVGIIAGALWWFFGKRGNPSAGNAARLQVLLNATGLFLSGQPTDVSTIVTLAKERNAIVDLTVTGDASQGSFQALKAALDTNGIVYYQKALGDVVGMAIPSRSMYRLGNSR